MSRIGKQPVIVPQGVTVKLEGNELTVTGPKGTLSISVNPLVSVVVDGQKIITIIKETAQKRERALWGTMRSLINNLVKGVHEGFEKKLEVIGVGYRVAADKKKITLNLGYSHPIELAIPEGIEVKVEKNVITVSGPDKQLVGEFSALIRSQREPEPYKGKGVKYADEVVRRKAGKVMKAVGG